MRRAATLTAGIAALWLAPSAAAWAHGIGVRGDLPLPLWVVSYGAIGVLVISFAALVRLWPEPRLQPAAITAGEDAPALGPGGWAVRVLGLLAFALMLVAAFVGPVSSQNNLAPFAIYVVLWVGGMFVSGFVGDLWYLLNPFETVAALVRPLHADADNEPAWLQRAGVWPAAVMLTGFAWLELVHPDPANPRVLAASMIAYALIVVLGVVLWGPRWVHAADAFGAFFRVLAAMAPVYRGDDGRLHLRAPLTGLPRLRSEPGQAALILVGLGSTTFDGVTRTELWATIAGPGSTSDVVPITTVGLLVTILVVAGLYVFAMRDAARHSAADTRELVADFAHTLVPIALAYAVAHYFSLLAFEGQRLIALASDPLGQGWDLFGTVDWSVNFALVSTTVIAVVQVAAIVIGHIAGVVLAHDRAVARFEGSAASRSQYTLLVVMVAYTVGALLLLLGA